MSSMGPLIHLNEFKGQLLGDGIGEDVVDAKIMHQCVVDKEHVERPLEGHHLLMEEHNNNVFFASKL